MNFINFGDLSTSSNAIISLKRLILFVVCEKIPPKQSHQPQLYFVLSTNLQSMLT